MVKLTNHLVLCVYFLAFNVFAANKYDESIDCERVDKDGGSGYELSQCAGRAIEAEAFQLNKVYGQIRTKVKNTPHEKALIDAQRAWLIWRDKEAAMCAHSSGFDPMGSGYGVAFGSCKSLITTERVRGLREYLRMMQPQ